MDRQIRKSILRNMRLLDKRQQFVNRWGARNKALWLYESANDICSGSQRAALAKELFHYSTAIHHAYCRRVKLLSRA